MQKPHILDMAAVGKAVLDTLFYQRLFSRLALFALLVMMTAILTCLVIAGLFGTAFVVLVQYGMEADMALLIVGGGVVAVTIGFCIWTLNTLKKLRRTLQPFTPLVDGIGDVAEAFVSGILTKPHPTHQRRDYESA